MPQGLLGLAVKGRQAHNFSYSEAIMTRLLITTALAACLSLPASAAYICEPATQVAGKSSVNHVVRTVVAMTNDHQWVIEHHLADGAIINRADQYNMRDGNDLSWYGTLKRRPNLLMVGTFRYTGSNQAIYGEILTDMNQNNKVLMASVAACAKWLPPASAPTSSAPAPSAPGRVALDTTGTLTRFNVQLGSQAISIVLDTGASDISLPADIVAGLIARGEAAYTGQSNSYQMADGSTRLCRQLIIHNVEVGSASIHEVPASEAADGSMPLFGMAALNMLGKFTLDTAHSELIFGGAP